MDRHKSLINAVEKSQPGTYYVPLLIEIFATLLEDVENGSVTKEKAVDILSYWLTNNLEIVQLFDTYSKWKDEYDNGTSN